MSRPTPDGAAVFPAGLTFRVESDGAVIGNRGDVVIETNLAAALGPIKRIFSELGSVRLAAPELTVESVHAERGEVIVSGAVQIQHLRARVVRFTDGVLKARVIQAGEEAELVGASIEAEVVVAPRVAFGPETAGRATAVGAGNDLGPHKVRGCFSLSEYVDLFPAGRATLDSFGISVHEPHTAAADGGEPERAARAPAPDDEDEEEGDPSGEKAPAAASTDGGSELDGPLREAMRRIEECYGHEEAPAPIALLGALVAEGRHDEIRLQLNGIWRDLLKYHQKKGLRISNTVTQQFQAIQILMKRSS